MTFSTCNKQAAPFWLLWCPTVTNPPRFQHDTYESAEREAERLACIYPGNTFYVVEPRYSVNTGPQRITYVAPIDDEELPF